MPLWDRDRETEGEGGVGILGFMSVRGGTVSEKHGGRRDLRDRLISWDFSNPHCLFRLADPAIQKAKTKNPIEVSEYSGTELILSYISDPFGFVVKRKSDGQVLFNSSSESKHPYGELVFKDQYLEISTRLPKDASLYGIGENSQPHGIKLYSNDPYSLFTTDVSAINLNTDLYGSHPVYMDLRNVGNEAYAHSVLLLNSNGMDVDFSQLQGHWGYFRLLLLCWADAVVVDQYTAFIGRPAPMAYWSLVLRKSKKKEPLLDLPKEYYDDLHTDGHMKLQMQIFLKVHDDPSNAPV